MIGIRLHAVFSLESVSSIVTISYIVDGMVAVEYGGQSHPRKLFQNPFLSHDHAIPGRGDDSFPSYEFIYLAFYNNIQLP